ncbi:hypothetical protein RND71_030436 [Anisodus tanguticus]|uniref:Uncharacterized protein n=1 Tax=Anisodus tanguticus TaxID=243964 RepID=A0AAE1RHJ4_9SOLA|nr:hypothetical protein RND71_030436 [Anisodus tanguticus]
MAISGHWAFAFGVLAKKARAPNILGFIFGILQMVLYAMYRKKVPIFKEQNLPELQNPVIILDDNKKIPELTEEQIIDIVKLGKLVCSGKIQMASTLNQNAAKEEKLPNMQTVEA